MCGRAKLPTDYSEIKIELRFDKRFPAPNFPASWNIAPTQGVLTAIRDPETGARRPVVMRWGLIPTWAKDLKIGYSTFNARADTLTTKPAFRGAWRAGRRCLVITDGFYEWRKTDKQPFAIECPGALTVMAGLWEAWTSPAGERITSCTIVTTDANEELALLHDRMPVILKPGDWSAWLGEDEADDAALKALLVPYSGSLRIYPVSKRVGNVRNNDASLAEPIRSA